MYFSCPSPCRHAHQGACPLAKPSILQPALPLVQDCPYAESQMPSSLCHSFLQRLEKEEKNRL